jgi:hypothetical protein
MAEFKHVLKQEKNIEKKYAKLTDETKHLLDKSESKQIKEKIKDLEKKKKKEKLDWNEEVMLDIYYDALKNRK